MSFVNRLISNIKEVHRLFKLQKAAEKAKVEQIRNEALRIFQGCYSEFKEYQLISNTATVSSTDHAEVITLLAEAAFYTNQISIARELVEYYFQNEPSKNQFFVRNKILLALIIDDENKLLHGIHSINARKIAMQEISQALEVILQPNNVSRYGFLLYNLTLAAWKIVRQYLRKDHSKYFITEFQAILQAVEQQPIVNLLPPELPSSSLAVAMDSLSLDEESDIFVMVEEMKEWKIWLYTVAATCLDDDKTNKSNTAVENIEKAIVIMEELYNITAQFEAKQTKTLQSYQKDVDLLMNAFRAIEDRKELMAKPIKIDPDIPLDDEYYTKPREYPPLEGLAAEGFDKIKEKLDIVQEKKAIIESKFRRLINKKSLQREKLMKLYSYRVMLNPADAKRYVGATANIGKDIRINTLVTLQCIVSNAIVGEKEIETTVQQLMKKLETFTPINETRNETLLDVARFCWTNKLLPLARQCMDILQANPVNMTKMIRIKLDICESLKNFYEIEADVIRKANAQLLTKKQIDGMKLSQRLDSIKLLERVLLMCNTPSFEDKYLVLEICLIVWNFIIPFLTKKLRMKVHSTLRIMATALEANQANYLLPLLQSNVHYELGLCEETLDYVGMAKTEIEKALYQDYGEVKPLEKGQENSTVGIPAGTYLESDRLNDEYLVPMLRALELRVDVYSTPSTIDGQVVLWLQQAKEATSKSLIKDLITKCAVLLFDDLEASLLKGLPSVEKLPEDLGTVSEQSVDFSLVLLKRGAMSVPEISLSELKTIFTLPTNEDGSPAPAPTAETFSYAKQQRFKNLYTLILLASQVQEVNIIQQASFYLLKQFYNESDFFAREFLDAQIEVCSLFAESIGIRLQSEGKKLFAATASTASLARRSSTANKTSKASLSSTAWNESKKSIYLSLGVTTTDIPEELASWKILILQSLIKGYQLALKQKDIYAIQNNLVYFWNLHVHIFRNNMYSNLMNEVFEYLKMVVDSFESVVSFPYTNLSCDVKLFLQLFDALVNVYESKQQFVEAVELAKKGGMTFVFPTLPLGTCEACYYRKGLIEKASKLSVLNALNGVSAAAAGKGGKGGAPPSAEVLVVAENCFLTVYANLAIAEFYPAETIPAQILSDALSKAISLIQTDVKAFIAAEEDKESKGIYVRTREKTFQRVEMQLECYTRLARLKILYSDYVNGQFLAQNGLQIFSNVHKLFRKNSTSYASADKTLELDDEDNDIDDTSSAFSSTAKLTNSNDEHGMGLEYEPYGTHILRYLSTCEQMMALALMSFIEANSSGDALANADEEGKEGGSGSVLDPELITQLQYISVEHLQSAILYAIVSKEETLLQDYLTLAYSLLQTLLPSDPIQANPVYFPKSYKLTLKIITIMTQSRNYFKLLLVPTQILWRNYYLLLINLLIFRKEYSVAYQLNNQAFEQISNTDLQKELWPSKVICMSKKGMNVLDGLQKLKEKDVLLQAQVLILFARSTKDLSNKISKYQQALVLLENRMEYLDYLFELIEVLTEKGLPRSEIQSIISLGLEFCYTIEENEHEEVKTWELEDEYGDEEEVIIVGDVLDSRVDSTAGTNLKRTQSATSKSKMSVGGGGISKAGASARGSSVRGNSAQGAGSRRTSVANTKSRVGSHVGSSVRGDGAAKKKEGDEDEKPTKLDNKGYEQLTRLLIMTTKIAISNEKKFAISLQCIYFIQKIWNMWIDVLKDEYRIECYEKLSETEKETMSIDKFVVSSYPDYFQLPNSRLEYLGFSAHPAIRDALTKAAVNHPAHLPSLTSFPTLSMTCHYLYELIVLLQENKFFNLAVYVISFLRTLLWTVPLIPGSENDRLVVLVWCQLITLQLQSQLGASAHGTTGYESFVLDPSVDAEAANPPPPPAAVPLTGGKDKGAPPPEPTPPPPYKQLKFISPGKIISQFITSLQSYYYQHDISHTTILDLTYSDLFHAMQHADDSSAISTNSTAGLPSFPPFGIETTTLVFTSYQQVDNTFFWMKCIPVLLSLGQFPIAEQLCLSLLFDQRMKKSLRYFSETTSYYHQLLALKGIQQEAIANVLSQKMILSKISDCELLFQHVHVLVRTYLKENLYEESRQTVWLLLTMLQDHAIRMITKPRSSANTAGINATVTMGVAALTGQVAADGSEDRALVTTSKTTLRPPNTTSSATIVTSKASKEDYSVMEIGYEYLKTLKNIVIDYAQFLLQFNIHKLKESLRVKDNSNSNNNQGSTMNNTSLAPNATNQVTVANKILPASNVFDPVVNYREYCEHFTRFIDLFQDLCGEERNEWILELQTLRAQGAIQYLTFLHKNYSRVLTLDDYTYWFQDNLSICVEYTQQVYITRKAWYEQYLESYLCESTTLSTVDASAGFTVPETGLAYTLQEFTAVSQNYNTKLLPPKGPEVSFGLAQLQFAMIQWQYLIASKQYMVTTTSYAAPVVQPVSMNPVEQYLEDTKPLENVLTIEHFRMDVIDNIVHLCSSAIYHLRTTQFEVQAKLLFLISQVSLAIKQKVFLNSWQLPPMTTTGNAPAAMTNDSNIPAEILTWREMLENTVKQLLAPANPTENNTLLELLASACLVLLESYGCERANQSIYWLALYQSIQSKLTLQVTWKTALSKKTEVSAALNRLEWMESQGYPNLETMPTYQTDKLFLQSASTPYRRLKVTSEENMWPVIDNVCSTQCLYLFLQFDSAQNVLYFGCGRNMTSSVANASMGKAPPPAKGAAPVITEKIPDANWMVDKITLSETQRRTLQVLQEQHRLWQQDVTKFVALANENYPPDEDLEPILLPSPTPSMTPSNSMPNLAVPTPAPTTTQKAERALEERLRALIADLEQLLDGVIGVHGRVYQYLAQYLLATTAAPSTTTSTASLPGVANGPLSATAAVKWNLVLLLDATLHNLPWEGVKLCSQVFQGQVSRDYSLQLLYHRCAPLCATPLPATNAATPPPAPTTTLASSTVRYIVDPLQEDTGCKLPGRERAALGESVSGVVQSLPGGGKWTKLRGAKGTLSTEDFVLAFHTTTPPPVPTGNTAPVPAPAPTAFQSFLSLCLGRFAHFYSPQDVATSNFDKVLLWYCFDQAYNETSYRRLNSTEVLKRSVEVDLEQSAQMIALLSLSGIASQVHNCWSIPIFTQQRYLQLMMKAFTKKEKLMFSLQEGEQVLAKQNLRVKRWIKLARVVYGVPNLTYSE